MVVSAGINSSHFIIMSSLVQKASWFLLEDPGATANYSRAVRSRWLSNFQLVLEKTRAYLQRFDSAQFAAAVACVAPVQ